MKAIYAGKRFVNGKLFQAFVRTDNKKQMLFRGVRNVYVGYEYRCTASQIKSRPERASDAVHTNPAWEAAEELAIAEFRKIQQRKRVEKQFRDAAKPTLKTAVAAIAPLFDGLDFFDCEKLGSILGKYVYDARRKSERKKK